MNIPELRGYITEEIAKYHMQKLRYKVVPIGREKIEQELSDLLLFIRNSMNHINKTSQDTFNLFENTISKLPDYAIWKVEKNSMTFRFLEVKFRNTIDKLKMHDKENKYSLNIKISDDQNELNIFKYIKNLQNLYGISNDNNKSSKIDNIEFYIYVITKIDDKYVPLIGKIQSSTYSDFFTYLYTPEQLNDHKNLKALWGEEYDIVSNFFMKNNKLEHIFSEDFLVPLLDKNTDEISSIVYNTLDKFNLDS